MVFLFSFLVPLPPSSFFFSLFLFYPFFSAGRLYPLIINCILAITNLYLQAGGLHLRLAAFFDNPTAKDYRKGLLALYLATTLFLDEVLNLEKNVGPVLAYIPNYIYQMTLAAGFILLKLCKSFFAAHIDMDYTKALFNRTIWAIRSMSVSSNDLPERLAEVLAQMWRTGGAPVSPHVSRSSVSPEMDDTLQLKVRCRMSMSLVYDSVWRWREDFQAKGKNLECTSSLTTNLRLSVYMSRPVILTTIKQPSSKTQPTRTPMQTPQRPLLPRYAVQAQRLVFPAQTPTFHPHHHLTQLTSAEKGISIHLVPETGWDSWVVSWNRITKYLIL